MSKKKWLILFIVIQVLDLLSTLMGIIFLEFIELNPIMSQLTLFQMSFFKIIGFSFVAIMSYIAIKRLPKWFYIGINILSAIPVLTNTIQIVIELALQRS